jgi:hypothetical protein
MQWICARVVRDVEALWQALGRAFGAFTPTQRGHYLAHAGQVPPDRERALVQGR